MIKQKAVRLLKSNFKYLAFFYKYLKVRLIYIVLLSFFVSLLDALSLSMFIPLFEVASGHTNTAQASGLQSFLERFDVSLTINNILLLMLVFFLFKGVARYMDVYFRASISAYFIKNMRIRLLRLISNLKYSKFMATDQGTIQNTVSVEIAGVISSYQLYISVFQNFIFVLVYIAMSLWANSKFTLIVIFGGLLSRFLLTRFYSNSEALSSSVTEKNNNFLSLVLQQVTNFKYLKSTAVMPLYVSKIMTNIDETENHQMKLGYISARVLSLREPIIISFLILAIYIQVNVLHGQLGTIVLTLLFFYRAFSSLMMVQTNWMGFLKYVGSIIHIEKFEKELATAQEHPSGKKFPGIKSEIEMRDVVFSFNTGANVIRNLSYTIPKNTTTAIVGKSGSGKTTLVNMLSGLLAPNSGEILVDGVSLREYELNSYRSTIGLISQETVVFNDTVFNNVTLWAERSEENLRLFFDVAAKVDLVDFIENAPFKENTMLGDSGVVMSGGQRQRLSIARELFKKTGLLILDEATSALDSHTERLIQESIERIKGQATIIIIAHRLSTIKSADQILLLKGGQIESSGNFRELIASSPTFASMVAMQEI
jgi:ABC-type multidrug transport system fused ATPase/permease subunit